MTTDLHTILRTAVEQRMEVAKAATGWGLPPWKYRSLSMKYDGITGARGEHVMTFAHHYEPVVDIVAFVEANDPATILRHCERDLAVLERHRPILAQITVEWTACAYDWQDGDGWRTDYPCDEIRGLALAYGVEISDG